MGSSFSAALRASVTLVLEQLSHHRVQQTVIVNVTTPPTEAASTTSATAQSEESTSDKPAPKAGAKGVPTPKARRVRWYCVPHVPNQGLQHLLGLWNTDWATLEASLPGGRLFGSGCNGVKGFDSRQGALDWWFAKGHTEYPVVRHGEGTRTPHTDTES